MTATGVLGDYRWLLGAEAAALMAETAERREPLVAATSRLRKSLSPERTHLVLEQVSLRAKAREKFQAAAEQMFFTPLGLEQATDRVVASYKARRYPQDVTCADLCCGIGGDLAALAERGPTLGVDCQEHKVLMAEANCRALGAAHPARGLAAGVEEVDVARFDVWHLDPDRRPHGGRTIRVEDHEPNDNFIRGLLGSRPNGAVKLSPAASLPGDWREVAEAEWISRGGECRQLVVWFGALASEPGTCCATRIANGGAYETLRGPAAAVPQTATRIGRYLIEPDPAVLAAGLSGVLAEQHRLEGIEPGIGYLTGDVPVNGLLAASFEVTAILPFQPKRLKALLRSRGLGRLEVKKRGVPYDPEELRRQLHVPGDEAATLIVTRFQGTVTALVTRRVGRVETGDTPLVLPRTA
ncbi:MAG: hypothetical protein KF708_05880 [Pirellulales bacterium]|nr:hypothetical protein [Pirellulales bacterium]